jgi:hypothetical protein
MGIPPVALTVLKHTPAVLDGLGKLFQLFVDKKDSRTKEEFEKTFNTFKQELQLERAELAHNIDLLERKIGKLGSITYSLCGITALCLLYVLLHLARVVH